MFILVLVEAFVAILDIVVVVVNAFVVVNVAVWALFVVTDNIIFSCGN